MIDFRNAAAIAAALCGLCAANVTLAEPWWGQWGQNPEHRGFVRVKAEPLNRILADVVYDPFTLLEENDPNAYGGLLAHYQTPLLADDDVFMEFKTGTYTTLLTWGTQTWGEERLSWTGSQLVHAWSFSSDWKPVPFSFFGDVGPGWEPVFHGVVTHDAIFLPGFGGSVWKLNRRTGAALAHIRPFGNTVDANQYVVGPLSADQYGNVYYNVLKLVANAGPVDPWSVDNLGSWLVKISEDGTAQAVDWATLVPGTPAATDQCAHSFDYSTLPWPPSPTAIAPTAPCGTERPPVNTTPAIADDGTIYELSRAGNNSRWSYLVAINPDLTPKWVASFRQLFHDGCDVELPPSGTPDGCRGGSTPGIDPAENLPGSGRALDDSTSAPVVAPDGSIFVGTYSRYNYAQGHLLHYSRKGKLLNFFHFGWDTTPAVYRHDDTYSVITKENRYQDLGSYCNDPVACPSDRDMYNPANPVKYLLTQLSPGLKTEWSWQNTNQLTCNRDTNGQITCINTGTQPDGFEWCVNAPAVDSKGTVYGASEDGFLYAIGQGGVLKQKIFTRLAIGAAYTPMAIDDNGRVYTQNQGELFVIGR